MRTIAFDQRAGTGWPCTAQQAEGRQRARYCGEDEECSRRSLSVRQNAEHREQCGGEEEDDAEEPSHARNTTIRVPSVGLPLVPAMCMSTHAHPARVAALILTAALLGACNHTRSSLFAPRSAHEGYLNGLRAAGLDGTALGTRWQQAAEEALQNGPMVNTPFEETAYFPVHDPLALGYTVQPRRGERVHVAARVEAAEKVRVFLDVFEQPAGDRKSVV